MKKIRIEDWFDVDNIEHLKAFKHLQVERVWPEGFLPKHVKQGCLWYFNLTLKLAGAWLDLNIG